MFFRMWDLLYLKGRIQVFNEKWGQDSGLKLCEVPQICSRIMDCRRIKLGMTGLRNPIGHSHVVIWSYN